MTLKSYFLPPPGAIGQLLDSLEEIQVLTGAEDDDVSFLQNFFEHQTLQALLEVTTTVHFVSGNVVSPYRWLRISILHIIVKIITGMYGLES